MLDDIHVQHGGAFPKSADPGASPATQNTVPHWLQQILQAVATDAKLEAVRALIEALEGKDFATEPTLANIEAALATLNSEDFATSSKQDAALAVLDAINANTDGLEGKLDTAIGNQGVPGTGLTAIPGGGTGELGYLASMHDLESKKTMVGAQSLTAAQNATQKVQAVKVVRPVEGWEVTRADTFISVSPGQSTIASWQPVVYSENLTTETNDIVVQLDAGNNMVGQIFRASMDNIAELSVKLSAITSPQTVDDFSGYDAVANPIGNTWVATDSVNTPVALDAGSMRISVTSGPGSPSLLDKVTRTYGVNQNWNGFLNVYLNLRQTQPTNKIQVRMRLYDAAGISSSTLLSLTTVNVVEQKSIPASSFVRDGATDPNYSQIRKVEFEIASASATGNIWIDDISYATSLGTVDVSIYDLGATIPNSLTGKPKVVFDDGTDFYRISDLTSVVAIVDLPIKKGSMGKAGITKGNYYGIVFHNKSGATTALRLHGRSTGNPYASGNVFSSADSGANLTHSPDADAAFLVMAVPDVALITYIEGDVDGQPKTSTCNLLNLNISNGSIANYVANKFRLFNKNSEEADLSQFPIQITKGQFLKIIWNSDPTSTSTGGNLSFRYLYPPIARYQ